MTKKKWVRSLTSLFSLIAILAVSTSVTLGFADKDAMGEITVLGNSDGNGSYVLLNGEKAYNGRTFISSGTIKTEDKPAIIKLKNLGAVKLAPNTTLSLDASGTNISGTLSNGKINVSNAEGVKVDIETANGKISNQGTESNVFNMELTDGNLKAFSEKGSVIMENGSNTTVVTAKQDDDDDDEDGAAIALLAIFGGVVAGAALIVLLNQDDDDELQTLSAIF